MLVIFILAIYGVIMKLIGKIADNKTIIPFSDTPVCRNGAESEIARSHYFYKGFFFAKGWAGRRGSHAHPASCRKVDRH